MKQLLVFIFIALTSLPNFSQDHYYYKGEKVTLTPRADKIALIFNDSSQAKTFQKNKLTQMIRSKDNAVDVEDFIILINLAENKNYSTVESYLNTFARETGADGNLKFATKVYYGESERVSQIPADEIIVKLNSVDDLKILVSLNEKHKLTIVRNIGDEKTFLLKSRTNVRLNALELSGIYYDSGIFEYAEPNFYYPEYGLLHFDPNDPLFNQQWALKNTGQSVPTGGFSSFGDLTNVNGIPGADMDVERAWVYTTGSASVIVGVFDTGIDSTHPDLSANMVRGYDATTGNYGAAVDPNGHGTACAGIIAAIMNNSIGIAGIAPSTKLMNIRIFNAQGTTTTTNIIRALEAAFDSNVDVMSHSWGGGSPSSSIENAFNNNIINGRGGKGMIALVSTGNDGRNPPSYPAAYDNVVGVGASTPHDTKKSAGTGNQFWWGGNFGSRSGSSYMAFVTPTVCYTTAPGGNYTSTFNGTSASCPNAAGVAALVLSINLNLTASQVYEFMARGCEKVDNVIYEEDKVFGKWNAYYGYGRVNAYNSVRLAAGFDVTPLR
jgi:subtilisin family serine protease